LADLNLGVETEPAQRLTKRLAREEGILAGVSAGAALWAGIDIAKKLPKQERAVIVMIFPDSGEKYLSERYWSEE
jgi:cysteine synthase